MGSTVMIPLSEYLTTSYSPDREWVHGELRERNMGEKPHSVVQTFFIRYFGPQEAALGVEVYTEYRVQVSEENYRVPDVVFIRKSDPDEFIVTTPPMLCVEVLSREDRMSRMREKVEDYLRMGVQAVWVVDPWRRTAMQSAGGGLVEVMELAVPGTAIAVPLAEILADLDRRMGVVR